MNGLRRYPIVEHAHLLLNGHTLDWYGLDLAGDTIAVAAPETAVSYRTVPGMAGSHDLTLTDPVGSAYMGRRDVSFPVVTLEDMSTEARLRLGGIIGTNVTLRYGDMPGHWKGRLAVSDWEERSVGASYRDAFATLTINAYPYLLGHNIIENVSDGLNSIHVPGNRCAWPVFNLTVNDDISTMSVNDYRGHKLTVKPDTAMSEGSQVVIDMREGVARLNGVIVPVSLDSDYFPLVPGVPNIGLLNCSGTVTFQPEWMI